MLRYFEQNFVHPIMLRYFEQNFVHPIMLRYFEQNLCCQEFYSWTTTTTDQGEKNPGFAEA